ncbi:hypothetical protein [Nonlabens agnitus]|uniref:Uncharacterized protein n=1 Tax=Nonlabens agnitus TaxID=870484 RepID=A0A2S9WTQ9_9FLAO|nr:hypothetical protein [Nonlabens agnitus]PRP66849.1 hypothetical protein BST86_06895 [Nonlabens agnitus]
MRTILLFILPLLFLSCSADNQEPDDIISNMNVSLKTSEDYSYFLGQGSDGSDIVISRKPENATLSEIIERTDPNQLIYKYTPASGFTGSDFVEIRHPRAMFDNSTADGMLILRINFTVE